MTTPYESSFSSHVPAIDVSEWQGRIDWSKVRGHGIDFAFVKASEGEHEVDSAVSRNVSHARDAGVLVSLYHFAHPGESAKRNARRFLGVAEKLVHVGDPVPVLDLEVTEGKTFHELWNWQHTWGSIVGEAFGCTTMLYSDESFLSRIPFPHHHRPLWGAAYGHAPSSWLAGLHAWQYSNAGRIPGIGPLVDLDSILRPIPTIGRKP